MCKCIDEINEQLKQQNRNTQVKQAFGMKGTIPNAMVSTEKADTNKREKSASIFASYCPFCGQKYDEEK